MTSLTSLVCQQAQAYGLPRETMGKVFNLASSDIVASATRLALVGLVALLLKKGLTKLGHSIDEALFPSVHVRGTASTWVGSFMASNPEVQRQLASYCLAAQDDVNEEDFDHPTSNERSNRLKRERGANYSWTASGMFVTHRPMQNRSIVLKVGGGKLWIQNRDSGFADSSTSTQFYSHIRTWFWNKHLVKEFLIMAYQVHHQKQVEELHIYNHLRNRAVWVGPLRRPVRPWSSVFLPEGIKDNVLQDVKAFLSPEEQLWYATKGIPHRRGYMLHGPPGSGKTTLATALASQLRLDLYCVNPAAAGMNDSRLEQCFQNCPKGSLILIEDIDCVMPTRRNDQNDKSASAHSGQKGSEDSLSTVTLSGVLNAIDGIASQEDSVLFASTNYPERLDEAVRRPSRFDVFVKFDYATRTQVEDMYKHFYTGRGDQSVQHLDLDLDIDSTEKTTYKDQYVIEDAAAEFADVVETKGINVSIATVQGYLLPYKKDPELALANAEEWAEGIRAQQAGVGNVNEGG